MSFPDILNTLIKIKVLVFSLLRGSQLTLRKTKEKSRKKLHITNDEEKKQPRENIVFSWRTSGGGGALTTAWARRHLRLTPFLRIIEPQSERSLPPTVAARPSVPIFFYDLLFQECIPNALWIDAVLWAPAFTLHLKCGCLWNGLEWYDGGDGLGGVGGEGKNRGGPCLIFASHQLRLSPGFHRPLLSLLLPGD